MRRLVAVAVFLFAISRASATGDDNTVGGAETVENKVRVTVEKTGETYSTKKAPARRKPLPPCDYDYIVVERKTDVPYVIKMCEGRIVDLYIPGERAEEVGAVAAAEAGRYVEEVLAPQVVIGANPAAQGLVGLPSWFWIEGWSGSVQAAPISAYGLTIDVRMSSGSVAWDFGDGRSMGGDLGRPYPAESSVRHAYQGPGTFTVTAAIALTAEYRVDGGAWIALPRLTASATTQHPVQERQAVLIER